MTVGWTRPERFSRGVGVVIAVGLAVTFVVFVVGALQGLLLLAFVLLVVLSGFYLLSNHPTRIRHDPIIANEPRLERGDIPKAANRQTPPPISVAQWYYAETNESVGPFAAHELKQRLAASAERWDTLVWRPDLSGWTRAGDIPELQDAADRPPLPRGQAGFSSERNDSFRESLKYSTRGIVGAIVLVGILIFINSHPSSPTSASTSDLATDAAERAATFSVADVAEVVDWNWRPEPAFAGTGAILWDVQLRNTSSQGIGFVTVKFFAYDANGNQITADEAWVVSIPPGETRSGKGYADLHGTEATATVQLQYFGFDSKESLLEQWVIDEQLANRRIDHFCRVEQAYKDKLAITEKSLKKRWPNDQDCRDGYKMQACLLSNASKAKPSEIAFMDSCKRIDMRPPRDPKTQELLCLFAYDKTPMWKEAIAGAKRCMPLITPTIAPAYRTWSSGMMRSND